MTIRPLRIAYMGTPDFSVPALEALIKGPHKVVCVYTQPPRPKGRGHQIQKSPVHELAEKYGLPVYTPKSLKRDEDAQDQFASHNLDVAVVAAYGLILPEFVLDAPRFGCLNIHASILPRWRGASPIQQAIWAGDKQSGVSIMQMEIGLDTGPVISESAVPITGETTAQNLHDELSTIGAVMIGDTLDYLSKDSDLRGVPQENDKATYAHLLRKEDGRIDWTQTAQRIDRQVRALNPWPGVWTMAGDKRLKILNAGLAPANLSLDDREGTILDREGHIVCGDKTVLKLLRVQPENAKPMDVNAAFNGGYLEVKSSLD